MSRTAFLKRMPLGFQGQASRVSEGTSTVNSAATGNGNVFPGMAVKVETNGKIYPITSSSDVVKGFALRAFPSQETTFGVSDKLGEAGAYRQGVFVPLLERGYLTTKVQRGKPVAGGNVYIRTAVSGDLSVGELEDGLMRSGTATAGSNTGNGVMSAVSVADNTATGSYVVKMLTSTTFSVTDPSNNKIGNGETGKAFSAGGLSFTLAAGATAFVSNDTFTIAVAQNITGLTQIPNAFFSSDGEEEAGIVEIAYRI